MRVFIAGPYSHPDPVINTRNAILAGEEVIKRGHIPFVPHLNHFWHFLCSHDIDFWYEYDLEWLRVCDIILRLPGESAGADNEVNRAIKHGIRVIYDISEL